MKHLNEWKEMKSSRSVLQIIEYLNVYTSFDTTAQAKSPCSIKHTLTTITDLHIIARSEFAWFTRCNFILFLQRRNERRFHYFYFDNAIFCERRCVHDNGEGGGGMCAEALGICCMEQRVVFTAFFLFRLVWYFSIILIQ
jgi:hypothetical protein